MKISNIQPQRPPFEKAKYVLAICIGVILIAHLANFILWIWDITTLRESAKIGATLCLITIPVWIVARAIYNAEKQKP